MKRIAYLLLLCLLIACGKENDPKPDKTETVQVPLEQSKRTVLIYAVASNDLYPSWLDDKEEILLGAERVAGLGDDVQVLVYSVIPKEMPTLSLVNKKNGNWEFTDIKTYERDRFSTDPIRMSEVFEDVKYYAPSDKYGLVMWSHATGWTPNFSDHNMNIDPVKRAFGLEIYKPDNETQLTDQCDIIDLVSAIPYGMFDYVWFDCCYMGSIEVAAEMSSKVPMMVAYPSEIWAEGVPYDLLLPYMASENPRLVDGAKKLSEYFETNNRAYTIGVYDLKNANFPKLAERFGTAMAIDPQADLTMVQKYSRSPFGPFYDLLDLCHGALYNVNTVQPALEISEELNKLVLYSNCSTRSFSGYDWHKESCSGISAHYPTASTSDSENYYRFTVWGIYVTEAMKSYSDMVSF